MPKKTATAAEVRTWARENEIAVGSRGRFSAELIAAFKKATRKTYAPA